MLHAMRSAIVLVMVLLPVGQARPDLIITEIMYDPASSPDGDFEYVEIYNNSSTAVNLAGYVIDDNAGVLTSANIDTGTVPAMGTAVIIPAGTRAAMEAAWGAQINFVEATTSLGLNNTGDSVGIWSSLASYGNHDFGTALDAVTYSNNLPWPGSGMVASIYLRSVTLPNDNAANWARSTDGIDGAWLSAPAGDAGDRNLGSPGVIIQNSGQQACCFPSGVCADLATNTCTSLGGTPRGTGSICSSTTCPVTTCCRGDVNGDGTINGGDIQQFVDALLDGEQCP